MTLTTNREPMPAYLIQFPLILKRGRSSLSSGAMHKGIDRGLSCSTQVHLCGGADGVLHRLLGGVCHVCDLPYRPWHAAVHPVLWVPWGHCRPARSCQTGHATP
eukprot:1157671-Pelagomonas_calceolata.AAC.2